jgi:hypothetical protein
MIPTCTLASSLAFLMVPTCQLAFASYVRIGPVKDTSAANPGWENPKNIPWPEAARAAGWRRGRRAAGAAGERSARPVRGRRARATGRRRLGGARVACAASWRRGRREDGARGDWTQAPGRRVGGVRGVLAARAESERRGRREGDAAGERVARAARRRRSLPPSAFPCFLRPASPSPSSSLCRRSASYSRRQTRRPAPPPPMTTAARVGHRGHNVAALDGDEDDMLRYDLLATSRHTPITVSSSSSLIAGGPWIRCWGCCAGSCSPSRYSHARPEVRRYNIDSSSLYAHYG